MYLEDAAKILELLDNEFSDEIACIRITSEKYKEHKMTQVIVTYVLTSTTE